MNLHSVLTIIFKSSIVIDLTIFFSIQSKIIYYFHYDSKLTSKCQKEHKLVPVITVMRMFCTTETLEYELSTEYVYRCGNDEVERTGQ